MIDDMNEFTIKIYKLFLLISLHTRSVPKNKTNLNSDPTIAIFIVFEKKDVTSAIK